MTFLDNRTIVILSIFILLVISIFVYISSKKNYKGITQWNIGNILITAGIAVFAMQGFKVLLSLILISNILQLAGYSFLSAALLFFLDMKPSKWFYIILNITHGSLMSFFIYAIYNTNTRIIITSLGYMIIITYTVVRIFKNSQLKRNRTYLFVLTTYHISFLTYLFKIVAAMTSSPITSMFDANTIIAITFIINVISHFIFTMNLYDILVKRFEDELIEKINGLKKSKDEIHSLHKELERRSSSIINQQKEVLEAIIENMADSIVVSDNKGKLLKINAEAKRLFYEIENTTVLGETFKTTRYLDIEGNDIPYENMPAPRALRGEKVRNARFIVKRPDKELIIETNSTPVYDTDGNIVMTVSNSRDITDQVQKDEIIRSQKEQLETIIENIDDAIFIFDSNKNYYLANKAAREYYPKSELKKFGDAYDTYKYYDFSGNEIPLENMTISKVFRGEVVINDIATLKNSTSTKHIIVNGRPIYDSNGNIKFAVLCSRDITREVEYQKTIESQNKKLEAIIESVSDSLFIVDKHGNRISINAKGKDLPSSFSIKENGDKEIYPKALPYDIDDKIIPFEKIPTNRVINGERFTGMRTTYKVSGKTIYTEVSGTPIYDSDGNFVIGILCSHDITQMVEYQEELIKQKNLLETIIDNSYENISVVDANGNYLANKNNIVKEIASKFPNLENIYQLVKFYDINENELPIEKNPAYKVRNGGTIKNEIVLVKAVGQEYYLLYSGKPILDKNGKFLYGIGCSRDITELVKSQRGLNEAHEKLLSTEREKNEALKKTIEKVSMINRLMEIISLRDKLFTVISHDIRNPLTTMISLIEILDKDKENFKSSIRDIICEISVQIKNTYLIVDELLDWFKNQKDGLNYNPSNCDISEIVQKTIDMYQSSVKSKDIKICNNIQEAVTGYMDKEIFEVITRNLISNAVKFTHKGGEISISSYKSNGRVIVGVKDNGIGMKPGKAETLFDKGSVNPTIGTAGEKGMGLGLVICKEFAYRNGGDLWVESEIGRGSTFFVSIPEDMQNYHQII